MSFFLEKLYWQWLHLYLTVSTGFGASMGFFMEAVYTPFSLLRQSLHTSFVPSLLYVIVSSGVLFPHFSQVFVPGMIVTSAVLRLGLPFLKFMQNQKHLKIALNL
jgi:hypothetical protein